MSLHNTQNNKEVVDSHAEFTNRLDSDLADFQDKAYDLGFEAGQRNISKELRVAIVDLIVSVNHHRHSKSLPSANEKIMYDFANKLVDMLEEMRP